MKNIFIPVFIFLTVVLFIQCTTNASNIRQSGVEDTNGGGIEDLLKAASVNHIYFFYQKDSQSQMSLPHAAIWLQHTGTEKVYEPGLHKNGLNIFTDLPAGTYRIRAVKFSNAFDLPVLQKIDAENSIIKLPVDKNLVIEVQPGELQYNGDFTIYYAGNKLVTAPAEYDNEKNHMQQASEIIMTKMPYSRWAAAAHRYMYKENHEN